MAVLIKGMEIPKCCADCDFADFRQFEEDRCSLTKTIIHFHYKGRNQDCPIVEVPENALIVDRHKLFNGEHNLYSWGEIEEAAIALELS